VCVIERIERTIEIEKKYMEVEEKGVKLRLTVVDTPGFNDAVDATHWSLSCHACWQYNPIQSNIHLYSASTMSNALQ